MSTAFAYRPDVDGLRTVAILPVVLFHLGIAGVSGGFVGVDIFFVISGFLITSIIHSEMESGTFSMKQFWVRRARRILPAMFVLLMFTLAAGWFLLAPSDYAELGKSARYQALFAANIFFWQESGYFDTAAEMKPLLHMWSLAVEEQFYFFFPLLLLLLKYMIPSRRLQALLVIAIGSFLLSAWSIGQYPSATFYLLPMRAWELMLGSLIVFLPSYSLANRLPLNVAGIAGLLAIMAAIVFYDSGTPFPGPAALLPTLGAAMIIWAGPNTVIARLLSMRLAVFVGLLSYSWYLWHWPLIVFIRYWQVGPLSLFQQAGLFCASLILAYGSYRLVENPFRRKRILGTDKKILATAGICIIVAVLVAQQIRVHEGFPERLPIAAQKYDSARHRDKSAKRCENISAEDLRQGNFCRLGTAQQNEQPLFVSWGDSHSGHYLPLFEAFAKEQHISFWHTSHIACSPFTREEQNAQCGRYNQAMLEMIIHNRIPNVILASRWTAFLGEVGKSGSSQPAGMDAVQSYKENLAGLVQKLRAQGCNVWLVKQSPEHPFEPPKYLAMLAMQGKNTSGLGRSYADHLQQQQSVNAVIDEIARQEGVYVLDSTEILCSDHRVCRTELDGTSLYRDDNHLSPTGALYIKAMLNPVVDYLRQR